MPCKSGHGRDDDGDGWDGSQALPAQPGRGTREQLNIASVGCHPPEIRRHRHRRKSHYASLRCAAWDHPRRYAQERVETAAQPIVVVVSEAVVGIGMGNGKADDDDDNDNDFDKPELHAIALLGTLITLRWPAVGASRQRRGAGERDENLFPLLSPAWPTPSCGMNDHLSA